MFGKGGSASDIYSGVKNWFGPSNNSGNSGDWSSAIARQNSLIPNPVED